MARFFKIGDAVEIISDQHKGKCGTIVTAMVSDGVNYLGIVLDERVEDGSDLGGNCEDGYGYWVRTTDIKKRPRFKMYDEVYWYSFAPFYGYKAQVIDQREDNEYRIRFIDQLHPDLIAMTALMEQVNDGYEVVVEENDLVKADPDKIIPFKYGDYVKLKSLDQLYEECGIAEDFEIADTISNNGRSYSIADYEVCEVGKAYKVYLVDDEYVTLDREYHMQVKTGLMTRAEEVEATYWLDNINLDLLGFRPSAVNISDVPVSRYLADRKKREFVRDLFTLASFGSFDDMVQLYKIMTENNHPLLSKRTSLWRMIHDKDVPVEGRIADILEGGVSAEVVYYPYCERYLHYDAATKEFIDFLVSREDVLSNDDHTVFICKNYVFLFIPLNDLEKLYDAAVFVAEYRGSVSPEFVTAMKHHDFAAMKAILAEKKAEYERLRVALMIDSQVDAYKSNIGEREEETVKESMVMVRDKIENYQMAIRNEYRKLRELELKLIGIQTNKNNGSTLFDFLKSMQSRLRYFKICSGEIRLTILQPLIMFEEDTYQAMDLRNNSTYRNIPKWEHQLLDDIFLHKKYTLYMEQSVIIAIESGSINGSSNWTYDNSASGIPNPHHFYFNCWGDNQHLISDAVIHGDYVNAIAQISSAISGINLRDHYVLEKFIKNELRDREFQAVSCLQNMETGEMISINDYCELFSKKMQEENREED